MFLEMIYILLATMLVNELFTAHNPPRAPRPNTLR